MSLLAQSGHLAAEFQCLLLGVERTSARILDIVLRPFVCALSQSWDVPSILWFYRFTGTFLIPVGSPSDLSFARRINMDEDRIAGTARKLGGKVQEDMGRFTGDTQTQIKGMANQAAGTAQDLYGQAADAARDTGATFDKWLRNTIETQPYTTTIVALGIGWLLGRMHRPL